MKLTVDKYLNIAIYYSEFPPGSRNDIAVRQSVSPSVRWNLQSFSQPSPGSELVFFMYKYIYFFFFFKPEMDSGSDLLCVFPYGTNPGNRQDLFFIQFWKRLLYYLSRLPKQCVRSLS